MPKSLRELAYEEWVANPYITARKISEKIALILYPDTKNLTDATKLVYSKHGGYINKLLSEFRSYHKIGLPLKPLISSGSGLPLEGRLEKRTFMWEFVDRRPFVGGVDCRKGEVPVGSLADERVFYGKPTRGRWVPIQNRNNMWAFKSDWGAVHWYPHGLVLLYLRGEFTQGALAKVKELFCKAFWWMKPEELKKYLDVPIRETERKWIFDVGRPMPRFKIRQFERSHGLTIYTDGSHPLSLHATETVPFWIDEQKQVNEKLSVNIDGLSSTVGQMGLEIREHLKLIGLWQKQSVATRKETDEQRKIIRTTEKMLSKITRAIEPLISKRVREVRAAERSQRRLSDFA